MIDFAGAFALAAAIIVALYMSVHFSILWSIRKWLDPKNEMNDYPLPFWIHLAIFVPATTITLVIVNLIIHLVTHLP